MSAAKTNILDLPCGALESHLESLGEKPYRARQVMKWIYHRDITDFHAMSDLTKGLRTMLDETCEVRLPRVDEERRASDGTRKWIVELDDASKVETVLIPDRGRNTLCVSSQVGCTLDCSFCATGKQGFKRNLTTAEIIGQVWIAAQALKRDGDTRGVTNIVLMGMGEPLLNFDNVVAATHLMMDDLAFGISKRRVTVSTAGVVPAIYALAKVSDVSLAVSLHAPNDALRDQLVPINRRYPIAELLDACRHYQRGMGEHRVVTFEYTLIRDVNDSIEQARRLAVLLRGNPCKVNLIAFNPFRGTTYTRPEADRVRAFQTQLVNAGLVAMLRVTRGDEIDAACGQLVGEFEDRTRRRSRYIARQRAENARVA